MNTTTSGDQVKVHTIFSLLVEALYTAPAATIPRNLDSNLPILEMFYVYITATVTDALPVCIHLLLLLSGGGPGLMLQCIHLQPKSLFATKDINKAG